MSQQRQPSFANMDLGGAYFGQLKELIGRSVNSHFVLIKVYLAGGKKLKLI